MEKSPLDELDAEIAGRPRREAEKKARVSELKKMLSNADEPGPRLQLLHKICTGYKLYFFDLASEMSILDMATARKYGSDADVTEAVILDSYILLSHGIINQAALSTDDFDRAIRNIQSVKK